MNRLFLLSIIVFLLTACVAQVQPLPVPPAADSSNPTDTPSPTDVSPSTETTSAVETLPSSDMLPSTETPSPTPEVALDTLTVALSQDLSEDFATPLMRALMQIDTVVAAEGEVAVEILDQPANAMTRIEWRPRQSASYRLAERFFAVVVPFNTVTDSIALEELQMRWLGLDERPVFVTGDTARKLRRALGDSQAQSVDPALLLPTLQGTPGAIALVPFDELDPGFKVLMIDERNVLSNQFDPEEYPLAVVLSVEGEGGELIAARLQGLINPYTNRDAGSLTTLIMTGVTAISRGTAAAIERTHLTYPADVISATLRAADIMHISNEVPFLDDCVVNNTLNNLVLCSHTDYMAVLEAVGMDIMGLSGNHVNDFGREGARRALQYYRDNDIAYYGSGFDVTEACAPLYWEHNGNTFAFVASLAFWPESAWATDELPGACYYYERKEQMLALVEQLAQEVDIVAIELQYYEHYDARPTAQQVVEFRELRERGAHLVTGVQNHVPQAWEPYSTYDTGGPGVILYGLGNLFFDQMWSWETRTNLIARHTIYEGRVLSTEILTTVLEDFAQPRWTEPEERAELLRRIFNAAPPR
jgi:hypothetical protein